MSNLPQQSTIKQYLADGATTVFTYPFMILLNSDINVYVTLSGNNPNPLVDLVPTSDYTVQNAGVIAGGTVTFTVAPAANSVVTLVRNMQLTISTQFADAQNYTGQNLDNVFQRIGLLLQQLQGYNFTNYPNGAISTSLQYVIDERLLTPPSTPPQSPVILPSLTMQNGVQVDGLVWVGQGGGITTTQLFQTGGDVATFAGLLASQTMGAPGASLVGYYDTVNNVPQTVNTFLQNIPTFLNNLNYIKASQLQSGFAVSADDTGAVNAIAITLNPVLTVYTAYNRFYVKIAHTNTGAVTFNVNGLGLGNVSHMDGSPILSGQLIAGTIAEFINDGGQWQWANPIVRVATSAETLAGTDAIHPATPAGIASGFNILGKSIVLPGGLIIKWGTTAAITAGNSTTFTFPVAFPTGVFSWSVVPSISLTTDNIYFGVSSITASGITVINGSGSTGGGLAVAFQFLVIGY